MTPNYSSVMKSYDMSDVASETRNYLAACIEDILKAIRTFYQGAGDPTIDRSISCRFKDTDFSENSAFVFYAGVYNSGDVGQEGETTVWVEVVNADEQRFTAHIDGSGQLSIFAPSGKAVTAIEFALFCDVIKTYWTTTPAWPTRTINIPK